MKLGSDHSDNEILAEKCVRYAHVTTLIIISVAYIYKSEDIKHTLYIKHHTQAVVSCLNA